MFSLEEQSSPRGSRDIFAVQKLPAEGEILETERSDFIVSAISAHRVPHIPLEREGSAYANFQSHYHQHRQFSCPSPITGFR
jgi:hypothetical protein